MEPRRSEARTDSPLWREYEIVRQGIISYDEHLYRIRSWSIAINALLLGGYFGINNDKPGDISPGLAILTVISVSISFWILDALNKSLQLVHIYNNQDLEKAIRDRLDYFGPTISLRFQKKLKRHFRSALKSLIDPSVRPFYLIPMASSSGLIALQSRERTICSPFWCPVSGDAFYVLIALGLVVGLLLISKSLQRKGGLVDRIFFRKKWDKFEYTQTIIKRFATLHDEGLVNIKSGYFYGFKADLHGKDFVIFVDSDLRSRELIYRDMRRQCLKGLGFSVFEKRVGDFEAEYDPHAEETEAHKTIRKLLDGDAGEPPP